MAAHIRSQDPSRLIHYEGDYEAWLTGGGAGTGTMADKGEALFQQLGWDEDDERFQEIYREMMVRFPAPSTAALITA